MLYIYGDSHAYYGFFRLNLPHVNMFQTHITMYRVGRDRQIPKFDASLHNEDTILCFVYGEIDCRCHIHKQILLGRNEDDIIRELVTNYIGSIQQNTQEHKAVIIVGVIPPMNQLEYLKRHTSMPFLGTEEERVRYTKKVNTLLEELCLKHGYIYFNPYEYYTRTDGTLKYEFSDGIVHLEHNEVFLDAFTMLYAPLFTGGL